jgi:hypothetical protein
MSDTALKAKPANAAVAGIESVRTSLGFNRMPCGSGITVYLAETKADYYASNTLLERANLTFLTPQEVVLAVAENRELRKKLGGTWFWLADVGINGTRPELLYAFDENGALSQRGLWVSPAEEGVRNRKSGFYPMDDKGVIAETAVPILVERLLSVRNGEHPLSMGVSQDDATAAENGRLFHLSAFTKPSNIAMVVIGKPRMQIATVLRVEKGESRIVVTPPDGEKLTIHASEGTTVELG